MTTLEKANTYLMTLSMGLWIGGGLAMTFSAPRIAAEQARAVQALKSHGVDVVVDDRGDLWTWDSKNKISYQLDRKTIDQLTKGASDAQ